MVEEDEEKIELYTQMIDGVEDKIKREAEAAKDRLDTIMHEIGDTLVTMRVLEENRHTKENITACLSQMEIKEDGLVEQIVELVEDFLGSEGSGKEKIMERVLQMEIKEDGLVEQIVELVEDFLGSEDSEKRKMVTRVSQIGIKKENLVESVVKLVEANLELVRKVYEGSFPPIADGGFARPRQIDEIPYGKLGRDGMQLMKSSGEHEMRVLAMLAHTSSSTDRDMILNCCGLIVGMCTLTNEAVTKYKWNGLAETEHPRGMIGHTYNILYAIDERYNTDYAQTFRGDFQEGADELFGKAKALRTCTYNLIASLPETPTPPGEGKAQEVVRYLKFAAHLIKEASELLSNASLFVIDPDNYEESMSGPESSVN
jgi:hypothetical protein